MYLVRLTYASRLAQNCTPDCIADIVEESKDHNRTANITGLLCYDSRFFLQCLEGPRDKVNEVYRHIVNDKRNTNVTLLDYSDIDIREFSHWAMTLIDASQLEEEVLLKYNAGHRFDPYNMSSIQAIAFLEAIH